MGSNPTQPGLVRLLPWLVLAALCPEAGPGRLVAGEPSPLRSAASKAPAVASVLLLDLAGSADLLPAGEAVWKPVNAPRLLNPGDRLRTRMNSRATLRLTDLSQLRLGELSELQVQPVTGDHSGPVYRLWRGILYFFHRDPPGRFRFETPTTSAAVRGTEFTLSFDAADRTELSLLDGAVECENAQGTCWPRAASRSWLSRAGLRWRGRCPWLNASTRSNGACTTPVCSTSQTSV